MSAQAIREDTVRVVIPVALYGDEDGARARRSWVDAIRKVLDGRLPAGHSFEVSHRPDAGVVIRATFRLPRQGSAGAITSAALALETIDQALQDVARRYRGGADVVEAIRQVTVKTNRAG